jgi:hypothetical protein
MHSPPVSTPNASPRPEARWLGRWFTAARRGGLLAMLPADVWHTLSAIVSFTSRDGRRDFSVDQLAVALGLSREQAIARLAQLAETRWQDQPLATLEHNTAGEVAGAVLAPIEALTGTRAPQPDEARPAAEAASVMDDDEGKADLAAALATVGLDADQVDRLLESFPRPRIRRQLDWLPARQARNPAALLIRAVEQDWGPPREGV